MTVSFVKHDSSDDSYSDATGTLTIGGGSGVDSIAKSGDTPLTGDVTLSEGTNVTLTQVGQDIEIASTGGGDVAGDTHAASSKATPVDADELPLVDSAASFGLKKLTWANLKATLKTYFDTLYASSSGAAPIGTPELIYRYTVTGSVKASIDTGADTPDAGSNDWTNGDLLEVYIYTRTDAAALTGAITLLANNDGSSIYDRIGVIGTNATASAANSLGQALWTFNTAGDNANSGAFGVYHIVFPNYNGTVGNKEAQATGSFASSTAANTQALVQHLSYRSTSALSRLKVAGSGGNLKIGSQLLIYKRRAS